MNFKLIHMTSSMDFVKENCRKDFEAVDGFEYPYINKVTWIDLEKLADQAVKNNVSVEELKTIQFAMALNDIVYGTNCCQYDEILNIAKNDVDMAFAVLSKIDNPKAYFHWDTMIGKFYTPLGISLDTLIDEVKEDKILLKNAPNVQQWIEQYGDGNEEMRSWLWNEIADRFNEHHVELSYDCYHKGRLVTAKKIDIGEYEATLEIAASRSGTIAVKVFFDFGVDPVSGKNVKFASLPEIIEINTGGNVKSITCVRDDDLIVFEKEEGQNPVTFDLDSDLVKKTVEAIVRDFQQDCYENVLPKNSHAVIKKYYKEDLIIFKDGKVSVMAVKGGCLAEKYKAAYGTRNFSTVEAILYGYTKLDVIRKRYKKIVKRAIKLQSKSSPSCKTIKIEFCDKDSSSVVTISPSILADFLDIEESIIYANSSIPDVFYYRISNNKILEKIAASYSLSLKKYIKLEEKIAKLMNKRKTAFLLGETPNCNGEKSVSLVAIDVNSLSKKDLKDLENGELYIDSGSYDKLILQTPDPV